ncbi:hypothetical protein F8517_23870 [Bacillus thuringiensis]|uniref:papain-like cysteine protease family protein n=1 Tax=Bacillus thuringiensis TaxID=1428 RepID=UPI00124DF0D2|nr:papain-like cysteine protease family protein [Bacillus thuringiensis]KAB2364580.1 hypothetical protein F8517_23870 [Bacillus thuringiensis]
MFEYEVPGLVPPIAQPYTMACWATVSTSMISWHDSTSYTIEEVMDKVGPKYRKIYDDNTGLFPVDTPELLQKLTLVAEPSGINYSVDGWLTLLQNYGPLWITVAPNPNEAWSMHAIIVIGLSSDDTVTGTKFKVIDPADGSIKDIVLTDMVKIFEAIASVEKIVIQVCHF